MNKYLAILVALIAIFPLNSEAGSCLVNGEPVSDNPPLIEGTSGPDVIDCSNAEVDLEIYGFGGDDVIQGGPHDDFIAGGSGKDELYGGPGNDAIDGGGDDDFIDGEADDDVLFGGVGASPASGVNCTLETTFIAAGSSYLTKGGSGDDTIYGGPGNDCINAGSGEDMVYGGPGNDTLKGGNHSDFLDGGLGNDYIDGGWHSDTCIGGGGNDIIINCEPNGGSESICGDFNCDADEDRCSCAADCYEPPYDELEQCNDKIDNDCDSYIDCSDLLDCGEDPVCDLPSCELLGNLCESSSDCCSNKCKGKPGSKTCK